MALIRNLLENIQLVDPCAIMHVADEAGVLSLLAQKPK